MPSDGGHRSHASMTYRSASARAVAFDDAVREAVELFDDALRAFVGQPVTEAVQPQAAGAADPAAGAVSPERHAADRVAADPAVLDPDSDRTYRDGVQHFTAYATAHDPVWVNGKPITAEAVRQSRLARWQAQR